jgi:hypothetical protein
MPAYHAQAVRADRKLFEFAKSPGVETIVGSANPEPLADLGTSFKADSSG